MKPDDLKRMPSDLPSALTAATKLHIAPIFKESPLQAAVKGSGREMRDQGTMTFIFYRDMCFGITNQHVTQNFKRPTSEEAMVLALSTHVPMPGRLIFSSTRTNADFPHDVSVFILNEDSIRAGGKTPLPLVHRKSPVIEKSRYLALGYPGHMRSHTEIGTRHPIYHIVATCVLSSERQFILQDELPASSEVMRFGGVSGGAVVETDDDGGYSLVGVIFEGRGQHEDVEHRVNEKDIWVYGVPIDQKWMDYILSDVHSKGLSLDVRPLKISVNIAPI